MCVCVCGGGGGVTGEDSHRLTERKGGRGGGGFNGEVIH